MFTEEQAWDYLRAISPLGTIDSAHKAYQGDWRGVAEGALYQGSAAVGLVGLDRALHIGMTARWSSYFYNWGPRLSFSEALAAPKRTMFQRVATHGLVGAYAPVGVAAVVAGAGYAHIKATQEIGIHNTSGEGLSLPVTQEAFDFFGF